MGAVVGPPGRVTLPASAVCSRVRQKLELMQRQADDAFDRATNLPSVLWQSGLLGYVEKDGEAHFYSQADMDQFDIPMDMDDYVFHPCMIDSARIRGIGDPVYPFRRN
jgi:hypothetical protein